MTKQEVLNEIKERYDWYKANITEEKFFFGSFVGQFDNVSNCGTVCCLWGWEPLRSSDLKWVDDIFESGKIVSKYPRDYLKWPEELTNLLYYPDVLEDINNVSIYNNLEEWSTLNEVLDYWQSVIKDLEETNKFDSLFK